MDYIIGILTGFIPLTKHPAIMILEYIMKKWREHENGSFDSAWMDAIRHQAEQYQKDVQAGKIKIPVQEPVKWKRL